MSNKLTKLARQLLIIEEDLWFRFDPDKDKSTRVDDFEVHMFEQTWGSTTLGFGGMGGQALTTENTFVFVPVTCNQNAFVYFGSQFAYEAEINSVFIEDLTVKCMKPCYQAGHYRKDVHK